MYSTADKKRARELLQSDLVIGVQEPDYDRVANEEELITLGSDRSAYLRDARAERVRRRYVVVGVAVAVAVVLLIVLLIVLAATGTSVGGYSGNSD